MGFWTYCCRKPQAYYWNSFGTSQYANNAFTFHSYPPVQGSSNQPWVDNQASWISISETGFAVKSDGTLWSLTGRGWWYGNGYASDGVYAVEGLPTGYGPARVGSDSDWASVHGTMLLKQDGSLWSLSGIGDGVNHTATAVGGYSSIGRYWNYETLPGSQNPGRRAFRAIVSSPIEAAVLASSQVAFTRKPSLQIVARKRFTPSYGDNFVLYESDSLDAEVTGSGATLDVEWFGRIPDSDNGRTSRGISITSGGSGYTSIPTAVVTPQGGDEDGGLSLSVRLAPVGVAGFSVTSAGSGYTYATATDSWTGASANAVVDGGFIVGWVMASPGSSNRQIGQGQSLTATVTGDGTGAAAEVVLATSSVVGILAVTSNPSCWTTPPLIQITGGGGSGATAVVTSLYGFISKINVLTGGSGYTTTKDIGGSFGRNGYYAIGVAAVPHPQDVSPNDHKDSSGRWIPVASLSLSGGPIVRIDGPQSGEVLGANANLGSDGVVKPFSITGFSYFLHSAELVGPEGRAVPLVISADPAASGYASYYDKTISLPSSVGGFGCSRPIIRAYFRPRTFSGFDYSATPSPSPPALKGLEVTTGRYSQCFKQGDSWERVADATFPYYSNYNYYGISNLGYRNVGANELVFVGEASVSGPRGGKSKYHSVDGMLFQTSREPATVSTSTAYPPDLVIRDQQEIDADYKLFSGKLRYSDYSINYQTDFLGDWDRWVPESLPETASLYCVLGDRGGTVAVAVSTPTRSGGGVSGYATAEIVSGGGGYTSEPDIYAAVRDTPYPVRVGSDTWKSVSLVSAGSNRYVGVRSDGKAFHWGFGDFFKPTPVGRGVTISSKSSTTKTAESITWDRLIVDRPAFGSLACDGGNWSGQSETSATRSGAMFVFAISNGRNSLGQNWAGNYFWYGINNTYWANSTGSTYGRTDFEHEVLYTKPHSLGLGYTSLPSVKYLEVDDNSPVANVEASFVGPETFDRVEGCLLIDAEGNAWDVNSSQVFPEPVVVSDVTTTSLSTAGDGLGYYSSWPAPNWGLNFFNTTTSFAVSARAKLWPNRISRLHLGSSVSSAGTATVSYPTASLPYQVDRSTTAATNETITCSDGREIVTKSTTVSGVSVRNDAALSDSFAYTPLPDGRINPFSTSLRRSASPPVITFESGDSFASVESVTSPQLMRKHSSALGATAASQGFTGYDGYRFYTYFYVTLQGGHGGWYRPSEDYIATDGTLDGMGFIKGLWFHRGASQSLWQATSIGPTGVPEQPVNVGGNISIVLDSVGSRYSEPPRVSLSQKPSVASATAILNGRITGAAVIASGQGFSSAPNLNLLSSGGSGGSLVAVIEGPVDKVSVNSGGSGYRCSPEVVFGVNGIPAEGTAVSSGAVSEIRVVRGGSRHRVPPSISISGSGFGASAEAAISGYVEYVTVVERGSGYTSAPTVSFSGGGGSGAEGIALLSSGSEGTYSVSRVVVTSGGHGYSSSPTVVFTGGGGSGATASATIDAAVASVSMTSGGSGYGPSTSAVVTSGSGTLLGLTLSMAVDSVSISYGGEYRSTPSVSFQPYGHIESVSLTSGGSGYTSPPLVGIVGGCGSGASAECTISGSVQSISVTDGGSGYTKPPIVELQGGYDPRTGSRATAHAVVSGGSVSSIVVDNPGSGYFEPPTVRIGEYSAAIIRCNADESGSITSAVVVSGGYGYASPPEVIPTGGDGAVLVAAVSGGVVTGVSIQVGGENYPASAIARVVSGIGTGASATAAFSGSVSSVTLTAPGGGYESDAPVFVFFSGGGGDGASSIATIGVSGSGASATSRINGTVVHADVQSSGSGYQHSPRVSVDMTGNFLVQESAALVSSGRRTQEEHEAFVNSCTPVVQSRIIGPVSSIQLDKQGDKYGSYDGRFGVSGKPSWTTSAGGPLGSPITSVSNPYTGSQQFFKPPDIDFGNSFTASCSISAKTGAFSVPHDLSPSSDSFAVQGYTIDRNSDPVGATTLSGMYMSGSLSAAQYTSSSGWLEQSNIRIPRYSSQPTAVIADVSGSGGAAVVTPALSGGAINITAGGSGYTLGAVPHLRGGTPGAWANPATATATLRADGTISSITVTNSGSGYSSEHLRFAASVYLDGGGESTGSLEPAGVMYENASGELYLFSRYGASYESFFRVFKTAPRVIIVANSAPSHRHEVYSYGDQKYIPLNTAMRRYARLSITNAKPTRLVRQRDSGVSVSSLTSVDIGRGWVAFPHYWDGWVDHVWLNEVSHSAKFGSFASPPSVSLVGGGEGSGASCHAELVRWTDVFCQGAAVRDEP